MFPPRGWTPSLLRALAAFSPPTSREGMRIRRAGESAGVSESAFSAMGSVNRILRLSKPSDVQATFSRARLARALSCAVVSRGRQMRSDLIASIPEGNGGLRTWLAPPQEDLRKFKVERCGGPGKGVWSLRKLAFGNAIRGATLTARRISGGARVPWARRRPWPV